MKHTRSYGWVSGWQEHQMLVHAEHTFERRHKHDEVDCNRNDRDLYRAKARKCN